MSDELLRDVGAIWERLAQLDPLWAVLSEPEKQGRNWNVEEFMSTGEREIAALLDDLREFGFNRFHDALDFGCGVGRLTQPLARRLDRATGVDISPTMVETARALAADQENARFVVNERTDLSLFEAASFDLVYSNIVLQHMPPDLARGYIAEFFRVVRPGGFVVFQIPSHLTEEWLPGGNDGTELAVGLHRAELQIVGAPDTISPGQDAVVKVRVRNASPGTWLQDLTNQINLGNHWLDGAGNMVIPNDGRSRIPGTVAPSEEFELDVSVRAPVEPGSYRLEFDVVQEGVTWFGSQGSTTVQVPVDVVASAPSSAGSSSVDDVTLSDTSVDGADPAPPTCDPSTNADPTLVGVTNSPVDVKEYPTFMMRGIRREDVERFVGELGGEVLDTREHTSEWVSYRYVTRRVT